MTVNFLIQQVHQIQDLQQKRHALNDISQKLLSLSLQDLEDVSAAGLFLFFKKQQGFDLDNAVMAYYILQQLHQYEDNLFYAAMSRKKVREFGAFLMHVAELKGISLSDYAVKVGA